jgi:hypothetical protein
MVIKHRKIGRNPRANFLLDRIGDISLLSVTIGTTYPLSGPRKGRISEGLPDWQAMEPHVEQAAIRFQSRKARQHVPIEVSGYALDI